MTGPTDSRPILVTGAAGFIGFHSVLALLARGQRVIGVDNLNDYYDVRLKQARLEVLLEQERFVFERTELADSDAVQRLFEKWRPERVLHLAAQAGVRYSLDNPLAYGTSNLTAFLNILEGCRNHLVSHLVYASSSSVYGSNESTPFRVEDPVDHPVSLYAATKKANELMAHTYSHLFGLPTTGLRFFTVYGPWGRPDMAYFKFTQAILAGRPIQVYNNGDLQRDFTYIDDIVEAVVRVLDRPPAPNDSLSAAEITSAVSRAPYRVYNIGNSSPVPLLEFISTLERLLGVQAVREFKPMQPGDVYTTFADVSELERDVGFAPSTTLEAGLRKFVEWYREFYQPTTPGEGCL